MVDKMDKITFPFQLDAEDKWYLGADSLQWIIYRKRIANGKEMMVGRSFIGDDHSLIYRDCREHGIEITAEAKAKIDSLPFNFLDFQAEYKTKSGKGRKKKVDN